MFVVEVGSVLSTLVWLRDLVVPSSGAAPAWFTGNVALWLWFTVVFANFAEAVAEGRGKAQAASLRGLRRDTIARRVAQSLRPPSVANHYAPGTIQAAAGCTLVGFGALMMVAFISRKDFSFSPRDPLCGWGSSSGAPPSGARGHRRTTTARSGPTQPRRPPALDARVMATAS